MAKLTFLGSASALPDEQHENTHFVIQKGSRTILVDCAASAFVRLAKAGISAMDIEDIILTHFHPDHVSGMPMLLMGMWLAGRRHKINLYGLSYTLERMKTMWDLFDWRTWPGFFDIDYHVVAEEELALVLSNDEIIIQSSPVKHFIPTLGLRMELPHSQKVITYSCDTEPCPAVTRLAQGADWLIHEAAGASTGHSSAAQAAEVARQAGAGGLCLVHYAAGNPEFLQSVEQARRIFAGEITTAEDFSTLLVS